MLLPSLYFIIGLAILIKGADWLVSACLQLAKRFQLSPFIVGVVLLSFGTSLPELAVSIGLSLQQDASNIILTNVIGSNIANTLLVLGTAAVLGGVRFARTGFTVQLGINVLVLSLFSFCYLTSFSAANANTISRGEGFVLLLSIAAYLYWISLSSKKNKNTATASSSNEAIPLTKNTSGKIAWLILLGLIMIGAGGELVSRHALSIAVNVFHANEAFAGIVLLALGTSLPELVTSIIASRRKANAMLLGNVLGSNIFNLLCIIGLSAVIAPLSELNHYFIELYVYAAALAALFCLAILGSYQGTDYKFSRLSGVFLLGAYVLYLGYCFYANTNILSV